MKKRRCLLACLLAVTMLGSLLTGCGSKQNSETAEATEDNNGGTVAASGTLEKDENGRVKVLNVGINLVPSDLTPWASIGGGHSYMMPVVYEFLGEKDTNAGELTYNLMKEYEQVDTLTYRVTIWDGISDAAGNPFTASDAVYSILQAREARAINPAVYVESAEALDDTTLEIHFTTDQYGLFELLASQVPMCTQAAYEASEDGFATYPVTTAPYQVTDYVSGSSITMELRDDYWQTEENRSAEMQTNVDKMVFKIITEPMQMTVALETGEIDMAQFISTDELVNFEEGGEQAGNFTIYPQENFLCQNLQFNMSGESVFSNSKELRQAVCYAIDAAAVRDGSVTTAGGTTTNAFGARVYSDYQEEWDNEDYYSYNLEKAKELVEASGVPASDLANIKIITMNSDVYKKMAQIIQGYLSQIGITASIEAYEQALFNTEIYNPSGYDIGIMGNGSSDGRITTLWRLVLDARQFEDGTMNFIHDDELQSDIETVISNDGYSAELIDKIADHLKEEAYLYGLFNQKMYIVTKPEITSVRLSYFGYVCPNASTFE